MTPSVDMMAYSDALVVLGTAGIVVPLVKKFGINSVVGYFVAGTIFGPFGLGMLAHDYAWLRWFSVTHPESLSGFAELGIVFLLFLIGLELSFGRLVTMRRLVFGLGGLQIMLSTLVLGGVLHWSGLNPAESAILGACLALSSTAIVVDLLAGQGRLSTTSGRASFSVLLAQDLAVVPLLFLISLFGKGSTQTLASGLATALLQAGLAIAAIVLIGRLALKPLFRLVASARSNELLIAAILFVIVFNGVLAAQAGLSMALGAFVAGLLLAETEYRKTIEALIDPFKGLLLGVFFFVIGLGVDWRQIAAQPGTLLLALFGFTLLKILVLYALARLFRLPRAAAFETALLLGPGGEFAFVGISAALVAGAVSPEAARLTLLVAALSMPLIPALAKLARYIETVFAPAKPTDPALLVRPEATQGHAIVVGHGRVGKVVASLLRAHKVPYLATDSDPVAVSRDRKAGHSVFYGNASDLAFLRQCGLAEARAVIVTVHSAPIIEAVVHLVRAERPDMPIISRARDANHACALYAIGVTDVVPETIEASLQLSEAALVALRVPMGKVIASIHEKRDEFREQLQNVAGRPTHAIKAPGSVKPALAAIEPQKS